jgi:hypothetical protein
MDQLSISDSDNIRIIEPTSPDVANDTAAAAAATTTTTKTRTTVVLNPLMEQNNDSNIMPFAEEEQLHVCNGSPPIDNIKKEKEFTCCEADMVGITASEKDSDNETYHGTSTKETVTVATSLLLESLINTNSNDDHSNSNTLFPPLHSNGISQEVEEGDECTPSVLPLNTTVGSTNASTMLSMSAPPDFFYRNHDRTMTGLQQQHQQPTRQQNRNFIDPLDDNAKLHPFQVPFSNCSTIPEQETITTTTNNNTNTNTSATNNQATTTANTKSPLKKESLPLFVPSFTYVSVSDPRYVTDSYYGVGSTTGVGFFSSLATGSSYWVYTVTSTLRSSTSTAADTQQSSTNAKQLTIHVQRRFRHFDALQDRLREVCPGSILPARYVVKMLPISLPATVSNSF